MTTVSVCTQGSIPFFCPFCGAKALTKMDTVVRRPCEHLVYISCSETPSEPWYLDSRIPSELGDDESYEDAIDRELRGGANLMFILHNPPPAGIEIWVAFHLDDAAGADDDAD